MSIIAIRSLLSCDGCGTRFSIDLDPARKYPDGWTSSDMTIESIKNGHDGVRKDWNGKQDWNSTMKFATYQGEHHLCPNCTEIVDEITSDTPSYDEVHDALKEV